MGCCYLLSVDGELDYPYLCPAESHQRSEYLKTYTAYPVPCHHPAAAAVPAAKTAAAPATAKA